MAIKFFSTGGTIDKVYFDQKSEFQVGETYLRELLLRANVSFEYTIEEIFRKDSIDITDEDRELILSKISTCAESKIVITHGTDSMAETGRVLKAVCDKTIVLTGAMQPARFHESDASFNIGCAVSAVQCLLAGVYLAVNGQIFDPSKVVKNRALNRFEMQS